MAVTVTVVAPAFSAITVGLTLNAMTDGCVSSSVTATVALLGEATA